MERDFPGRRAPTGEPDWLTLGQAAKFLGVAQSTIRKWSDQGRVPAFYTPGGHRRYRRRDLEAFLDRSGPGGATEGPLVLVVDDDARLRELIRVNLSLEGYTVREAASAEEALAAIEDTAPTSSCSTSSCPASTAGRCSSDAGAPRLDPGDHVLRQGRRESAAEAERARRAAASSASRSIRSS